MIRRRNAKSNEKSTPRARKQTTLKTVRRWWSERAQQSFLEGRDQNPEVIVSRVLQAATEGMSPIK